MTAAMPNARYFRRLLWACMVALLANVTLASAQELFKSPAEAAAALVAAARASNQSQLYAILGVEGRQIISSGDPVADAGDRQRFITAYDAKNAIKETGNTATLLVGQDEFPFPIPIIRSNGQWKFDAEAGRKEILFRRIGRNELDAIQASLAFFDAQYEYAAKDHGQGAGTYAQRIISRPGAKDGLYWPTAPGEEQSPLGELAAEAAADGYKASETRRPFHGYYYKILKKQGSGAVGGAADYVVGGRMIGGFALLAYPAEYGRSGVMSFIINHAGTVYQKDLGFGTNRTASRMRTFNPDSTWEKVSVAKDQ
ncbi:DUF2950 family protein [Bosea sp. BK604]|nr:DUF2950 family protein [Bosea sp. BK604]